MFRICKICAILLGKKVLLKRRSFEVLLSHKRFNPRVYNKTVPAVTLVKCAYGMQITQ
jgi:hypothetical protein